MTTFLLYSEEHTAALARLVAEKLQRGYCVLLQGTLGAGKTFFARHLVRALVGDDALEVVSPTFLLVQDYQAKAGFPVMHYDFYRLEREEELWELGLEEMTRTAVTIIEWPGIAMPYLPKDQLAISFEMVENQPDARSVTLEAYGACEPLLSQLHEEWTPDV